ncbi:hypothetical protein OIT44_06510 [Weissella ceti]|uniref:Uncharacterized protein n=1 Tax=Weissella ceti TaxID=759620 RepID=A0ABT3E5L7_9LACO|nr:hypothetical protein [Weissella ceti]MCW0953708.1 hypothetical protein [Weissella ceti]QVK12132.1 hypothetical protein KHQ31_00210 [Weissella ceti]
MKKWEELTSDELNLLEVLYWVAMFPETADKMPEDKEKPDGKAICVNALYRNIEFKKRMKEVNTHIWEEVGEGFEPKWPYEADRMKWDNETKINPLRSILNHLSADGFLEVNERMGDADIVSKISITDDDTPYNFKALAPEGQSLVFIQICRAGLVVAEQWIAHRKKLAAQQEEIAAQKAETEASKRLERIIGVMGGLAIVVAMLEWNWTEANLTMTVARSIMIVMLVGLAVWQWDAIRALFGLDKSKRSVKAE